MNPSNEVKEGLVAAIPNLRAFAMSLCGRSAWADDLVQETLVRAWAKSDSYQDGTNLMAWLFTIPQVPLQAPPMRPSIGARSNCFGPTST